MLQNSSVSPENLRKTKPAVQIHYRKKKCTKKTPVIHVKILEKYQTQLPKNQYPKIKIKNSLAKFICT